MANTIQPLNGLRGLAVLTVFASHLTNNTNVISGLFGKGAGQVGVALFFLLSGFLMAYLYANSDFSVQRVSKYVITRVMRIVPLVWIFITALVLIYHFFPDSGISARYFTKGLFDQYFMLEGRGVLWSIPPEFFYYFLFIFLWAARHYFKTIGFIVGAVLLYFFMKNVLLGLFPDETGKFVTRVLGGTGHFLLIGSVLGYAYTKIKWLRTSSKFYDIIFALACFGFLFCLPGVREMLGVRDVMWKWQRWSTLIMLVIFFISILKSPAGTRFFSNPVLVFYGQISFSLYLVHLRFIRMVMHHTESTSVIVVVSIVGATLGAWLLYMTIEHPFVLVGRNINRATSRLFERAREKSERKPEQAPPVIKPEIPVLKPEAPVMRQPAE